MERTQVLIVGGSLVGLSTALFLTKHGVNPTLVERHRTTSIHPRTPGYNARTLEYYRAAGIEDAVREANPWQINGTGILWAESLTSDNYRWIDPPNLEKADDTISPSQDVVLSQDKLEEVLREHAVRNGADLRFGTELLTFGQDEDGVTAELEDRGTGEQRTIRADYLIAADGNDSGIRQALGIGRHGIGVLENVASIMVRADLGDALQDKTFAIGQITNAQYEGMVRVVGDLLNLYVRFDPAKGESVEQFTEERSIELARAATGIPHLATEVLDVQAWQPTAAVADTMRQGRVFLVGDAAHVMPPSGAYGANTGIQDAANLTWKLAYVLHGQANASLLDSYDRERRPIADKTVDQAVATGREWFGSEIEDNGAELVDDLTLKFGYNYAGPPFDDPHQPTANEGTRLPHVWLDERTSTVDVWANGLALVTDNEDWAHAARRERLATTHEASWQHGTVLTRPDGFIAWRTDDQPHEDAAEVLGEAVRQTLS